MILLAVCVLSGIFGAQATPQPRLELFPWKGSWAISTGPSSCMGLDGLTLSCLERDRRPSALPLSLCGDSLSASFEMPVDEAVSEGDTIVHPPFALKGGSSTAPYASYRDLMLFGHLAKSPWLHLGTREGEAYVHPWSLKLCGDSAVLSESVKFHEPAILRAPFLSLLRIPVGVADTTLQDWNFGEIDERTFHRGAARYDGPVATAWLAVHDIAGRGRFVLEGARASGNRVSWRVSDDSRERRRILLEGIQFPEPRRVETLVVAPGALPVWIVEADENFGDGVRTRLWIIRLDTLLSERIGLRDADGETKESWSVDRSKGRIRIQAKGEKPRFVPLKN